jgi:hypothetical protein
VVFASKHISIQAASLPFKAIGFNALGTLDDLCHVLKKSGNLNRASTTNF